LMLWRSAVRSAGAAHVSSAAGSRHCARLDRCSAGAHHKSSRLRKLSAPHYRSSFAPCTGARRSGVSSRMMPQKVDIHFRLNGRERAITPSTSTVLADILREEIGLTGTKIGCDQGVCGACTVLIDDIPMASCSEFAF